MHDAIDQLVELAKGYGQKPTAIVPPELKEMAIEKLGDMVKIEVDESLTDVIYLLPSTYMVYT